MAHAGRSLPAWAILRLTYYSASRCPQFPQRRGDAIRFSLMRRVQVVQALVPLGRKVLEQAGEPVLHGRPARVTTRAVRVVDGSVEGTVRGRIDVMRLRGGDECTDTGRPLAHPDRRRTVGRWRKWFVRRELQAQKRARGFRLPQRCGLLDVQPVLAVAPSHELRRA